MNAGGAKSDRALSVRAWYERDQAAGRCVNGDVPEGRVDVGTVVPVVTQVSGGDVAGDQRWADNVHRRSLRGLRTALDLKRHDGWFCDT
jgi:hypothetical protein